jgi:hypothetical protein
LNLEAVRPFLTELIRPIVAELLAERDTGVEWIDQAQTLLGRRTHIALVRKMLAAGTPGAARRRRSHYLSKAAHDAELARLSTMPKPPGESLATEYLA